MAVFRIDIDINGRASIASLDNELKSIQKTSDNTSKSFKETSKSTDAVSSSMQKLGGVLAGVGLAKIAQEAVQLADSYKLMNSRLMLVVDSYNEYIAAQKEIFKLSQDTRASLDSTAQLYVKVSGAVDGLGKSQKQILDFTKAVNQSMKISGATTEEATSTVIQLSQALQSGALQGDEYRSLRENAPRLAKAIADGMGVEIGKLKELSSEGKLTAQVVFDAIEKSGSKLDEEFKKIPPTVSDTMVTVKNSFELAIGKIDEATGATSSLASGLDSMADSLSDNANYWAAYGQFVWATLDRTIDMFKLVGAFATNTVEYALGQMSSLFWGFTSIIADANLKATETLHSLGLSSESTFKTAQKWAASAQKNYDLSRQSVKDDIADFGAAIDNASATVEDRIAKMNARIKPLSITAKDHAKSSTTAGESKEELAAAKKRAEEYKRAIQALNDEGFRFSMDLIKQQEEAEKQETDAILKRWELSKNALIEYYTIIDDKASLFAIQESDRMQKMAEAGILSNEQMLEVWTKDNEAFRKEQSDKDNAFWIDLFKDIQKAMDNQLFDAMTGKWNSFGDWLKDFWSSLTTSIVRAASSQFSQTLIGGIQNMFTGKSGDASFLDSLFKVTAGATLGVGSTLSADQMTSLGWSGMEGESLITAGGTLIDASGKIMEAGTDLSDLAGTFSNLNSVYTMATQGLTSMLYAPSMYMGQLAGTAYGAGFTGTGSFLAGGANVLAGGGVQGLNGAAYAGGLATAGIAGGLGGYALGSLGDKLFGTDTKAGTGGAIGGAAGAIIGSIVPGLGTAIGGVIGSALGSLIGGAFGSKKVKDSGLYFAQQSAADNVDKFVMSFVDMQKKSWFGSKSWTDYKVLSPKEKEQITGIFDTYDYLIKALGDNDEIFLQAGKYSGQTFLDQLAKNFISVIKTGGNTDEIYSAWKDYADKIGVTIQEAFGTSIGELIQSQRTFKEWSLGGGTIEQLAFTAEYLRKDFDALASSMGVANISVGTFSSMYDMAIKQNFTPENIAKWDSLGKSLMAATEATNSYNKALLDNQLIMDDMLSQSLSKLSSAMNEVNQIAIKTINVFKSLKDATTSAKNALAPSASGDATKYFLTQFQDLKKEFLSNFDETGMAYAGSIEKMESDYSKLLNSVSSISGIGTTSQKTALMGQLDIFGAMFDKNAGALSVMIVGDETGSASESTLTNVEQWIKSLYEVQEQQKALETATMSQSTFEAGHILGTQEKVDFAKATGLTIGSESFNRAIADIQGFSTQSDDIGYLQSLISSGNTTSISALKAIGSSAPSDALGAISSLTSSYQNMTGQVESINRANAAETAKPKYDKAKQMMYSYLIGAFDAGSDHGKTAFAFLGSIGLPQWGHIRGNQAAYNEFISIADKAYSDELASIGYSSSSAQNFSGLVGNTAFWGSDLWGSFPDLSALSGEQQATINSYLQGKSILGFASGGYTGDMPINKIAGVTHGQEYVVNAKTTRDLGINNSGGLFREMATEIKKLRNEVSQLNQLAMSQLREIIGGNIIMRQVTNGGAAMMIEVI